jgi:hypothetical protein
MVGSNTNQPEVTAMTGVSADGRAAIRLFAEHEHEDIAAGIDRIHALGEELATLPVDRRTDCLRAILHWVEADLRPHMAWEESWLFPQIDARTGTPWATRLVRFEHHQIADQAERLREHGTCGSQLPSADAAAMIGDLARLEALLRANIEREERFFLPLLDAEEDRWAPSPRG